MNLLEFALTVTGLVMILNISSLFAPIRDYVKEAYKKRQIVLWWFLNSIFQCALCMGVWASIVVFGINLYCPTMIATAFNHVCIGSMASMLIISAHKRYL